MRKGIHKLLKCKIVNHNEADKQAKNWKDIEYFDESWLDRIKLMSGYISSGKTVMDLGCGKMWLKAMIPDSKYFPVDYKKRDDTTIVCDFNKLEFPDFPVDVTFISGCLEYIENYKWFIKEISSHSHRCIVSYCTIESIPNIAIRRKRAWKNDLKREELIEAFEKNSMKIKFEDKFGESNDIFVFDK